MAAMNVEYSVEVGARTEKLWGILVDVGVCEIFQVVAPGRNSGSQSAR